MSPSISLAPHLERALEAMSKDMAVEPQALINQAVSAWLRINGYLLPLPRGGEGASVVKSTPTPVPVPVAAPVPVPVPLPVPVIASPVPGVDIGPALVRMAEIDADLEKLAKPWPAWAPVQEEDVPVDEGEPEPEPEPEKNSEPLAPPTPSEDEADLDANTGETEVDEPGESTIVLRSVPIALYLEREGEKPIRITDSRFVIGRGPHCDLVIDSPRVSREHVALTRKGILFFIEDLGSSNGTWFGEERVTTRELESGDVISLGNVPMTFFLRGE